jgi:hypothetical protein
VRSLVVALSIAISIASALPVQAASPDDLDRIARSEICPADLRAYQRIPVIEACPDHQMTSTPDQLMQCRDDWLKDDARIARYNLFIQGCISKVMKTVETSGKTGGRTKVWKQIGSGPSQILSYPPSLPTSIAKGDEDRIPSTSIQPASAEPTCMDACMVNKTMRGTDPESPARKALCLFSCGINP